MSKLSLDLSQFKASGVYTVEQDASARAIVTNQTLRLVPGFSANGPFNAPVFLESVADRRRYFGDNDQKLERLGSFFHRSIDTCLQSTAVIALNLLNLKNDKGGYEAEDSTSFGFFATDASCKRLEPKDLDNESKGKTHTDFSGTTHYTNIFNTERFWKPSSTHLLDVVSAYVSKQASNENSKAASPLVSFANTGTKTISIISTKSKTSGYSVLAKDWYASESNIPYPWIRPNDYIKDYFIDVIAIEGDWDNYSKLAADPFWSYYFDVNGIKANKLNQFVSLSQINVLGSWTGTIIPNFMDANGSNQFIENIINSTTHLTNVLCNVNDEALESMVYNETAGSDGTWIIDTTGDVALHQVDMVGHGLRDYEKDAEKDIHVNMLSYNMVIPATETKFRDSSIQVVYDKVKYPTPSAGDPIQTLGVKEFYVKRETVEGELGKELSTRRFSVGSYVDKEKVVGQPNGLTVVTSKLWVAKRPEGIIFEDEKGKEISTLPGIYMITCAEGVKLAPAPVTPDPTPIVVKGRSVKTVEAPVEGEGSTPDGGSGTGNGNGTDVSLNSLVTIQSNIVDFVTYLKVYKMKGLQLKNRHLPGYSLTGARNNEAGVEKIYSMLMDGGIHRGLINPDMIQYRYIIDTMAYGLGPEMNGKKHLSKMAKQRGKTTAILNAPSVAQFSTNQDPYFCGTFSAQSPKPAFDAKYVAMGGNNDMQCSFKFSLPSEENGGKYSGVFGPFLTTQDNGKTIFMPPAAEVSNAFVRKFTGGDPYAIIANRNGVLSGRVTGVEYSYDTQDRQYLEPFGYNSIIERPSTGEVMIYSNASSYQIMKSDYNFLHTRELINTIELEVDEMLQRYVFEPNNAVTRMTVYNNVDLILKPIKSAGALYDYSIQIDDANNTSAVVDEGYMIIDVGVWVTKGSQKIINRITVNRLATESTGGSLYI